MVEQTAVEMGLADLGIMESDTLPINQLYVNYMEPPDAEQFPVVMVHGLTVSGKCYESQPDGRMGWAEYFVRNGYPAYVVDQVTRGRSGFNQAVYNNVRAGIAPPDSQPPFVRSGSNFVWVEFRIGTEPGVPFVDSQFPVDHIEDFLMRTVPCPFDYLDPNQTSRQLIQLATELEGAVLLGHSESAMYPIEAAVLNPSAVKAAVVIEAENPDVTIFTDEQLAILGEVPILFVYGDHLDAELFIPGGDWRVGFAKAQQFVERINALGGNAEILFPPDLGIFGNSHMIMNDKNSDQIADLIMAWIQKNSVSIVS
ncbi:hypothetical protein ACQPZ2_29070 [Nocardia pseudovaccinii]|uniref:hypothetical protein n=1 Tax=Nocardia pseudovaccinii TaxID=189540 RepID=UPI003D9412DA